MTTTSPRQELRFCVESGRLRDLTQSKLSDAATDLLVDVVIRYCEPRRPSKWKRRRK